MPKLPRKSLALILFAALLLNQVSFMVLNARAQTADPADPSREELESRINSKNSELEKLNRELAETQAKLETTKTEKASLQKELTSIKNNISQLNLSIRADKVSIEKLSLEVDSLKYDIQDIELSISDKREGVVQLLRRLQRSSQTNLVMVLLKGNSLADNLLEAQSLADTSSQLGIEISGLDELKNAKTKKVSDIDQKLNQISARKSSYEAKKNIIQEQEGEKETLLANTKSKESTYAQQLEELRKKQDEIADQIAKFEEELRKKFDASALPSKHSGVLAWPVQLKKDGGVGIVTQHMGEVSSLYRGKPHNGLDIGVPLGTPVYAAESGKVTAVDNNDLSSWRKYQYGKYVMIKHENNFVTLYAHLSKQVVSKGADVNRGDLIGYSGSTGYSTGPHLHFGLYWAPSVVFKIVPPAAGLVPIGVVLNPEEYL